MSDSVKKRGGECKKDTENLTKKLRKEKKERKRGK